MTYKVSILPPNAVLDPNQGGLGLSIGGQPAGLIPVTDGNDGWVLDSVGVIPGLGTAATLDFSVDGTMAADSDALLPTQKAVVTYVAAQTATAVRTNVQNTFTKGQAVTPVALVDGANIATNAALSNNFTLTIAGNNTIDNPTNLVAGQIINYVITQGAGGSHVPSWGNLFTFAGGSFTLSTGAGDVDVLSCLYDGTKLRCNGAIGFA